MHSRALFRDQRGAITLLFLITSTLVLGASFGAMDLVRYDVVQGRLQYALDGATLSAGRNLANLTPTPGTTAADQWQNDAFQYFRTNLPNGYLGSTVLPEDLKISYSEELSGANNYMTGQLINMSAKGSLPLISTGFFHISSFDVQASNQAMRRTRADLELVMALDNTGSMADDGKLDALKAAAKDLSTTVLGAAAASGVAQRVYIGLVPFADTVNVGNTAITRQWLTYPAEQTDFINNLWSGCIVEPRFAEGTDLPAKAWTPLAGFQPLHLTLDTQVSRRDLGLDHGPVNHFERIAPATKAAPQPRSFDQNGADYDRRVWATRTDDTSFDVFSAANPTNCTASRLSYFLNDDPGIINTAIDGMQAHGSTLIPTGLLWAWRMLDPAWRGTPGWGNPDMPRDPDPKVLTKVIVLLSDGQNDPPHAIDTSDHERQFAFELNYDIQTCTDDSWKSCSAPSPALAYLQPVFTAGNKYGNKQEPMNSLKMRDPFSGPGANDTQNPAIGWGSTKKISTSTVDSYLRTLCDNVKTDGNGIKIYTVTLGPVGGASETLMNDCSSGAGYFYNAATVSDLPDVFKSIAGALTELRLTS